MSKVHLTLEKNQGIAGNAPFVLHRVFRSPLIISCCKNSIANFILSYFNKANML